LIAVGTYKGYTQIWDVSANKKVNNLHGHTARVGERASVFFTCDVVANVNTWLSMFTVRHFL